MNKLVVIRQSTVANTDVIFEFEMKGMMFLIKNFTDGDIYVDVKEGTEKTGRILIPSGCWQVLDCPASIWTDTIAIMADTTNEKGVEVECLRW